jgi:hypothetical protein
MLCAVVVIGGCSGERIDATYGKRSGMQGGDSVNGTAVLANMFQRAGHQVRTKRILTEALMKKAEVIVWMPDDFQPPSQQVISWFDRWLSQGGRTLIYVGRDFDAAPGYYDKVIQGAPPDKVAELKRRRGNAQSDYSSDRASLPVSVDCRWFTIDNSKKFTSVRTLAGPWSSDVLASKAEIELRSRLRPKVYSSSYDDSLSHFYRRWAEVVGGPDDTARVWAEDDEKEERIPLLPLQASEVLLRSGNDILVSRQPYDDRTDSYLVLVANGSFLLNLPLVNHEHRNIARRLMGQFESPRMVVFLESTSDGPRIMDKEPSQSVPTGITLLTKRPLDVILFHAALVGIVFCLSRWVIFGRPRIGQREATSDFGKHVDALGQLLQHTGDREYAARKLQHYHQQTSDGQ